MLSFLYVYSDHSILECYNLFSGVELSMRSFFVIFVQSTLFIANKLFKDLCAVGGFTVVFRSFSYAIPEVMLILFAVGPLPSAARSSVWQLESMLFHVLGICFIRPCQLRINELFSEYFF